MFKTKSGTQEYHIKCEIVDTFNDSFLAVNFLNGENDLLIKKDIALINEYESVYPIGYRVVVRYYDPCIRDIEFYCAGTVVENHRFR